MLLTILAILCTGLFAGAAIYITAVEHPARLACGLTIAVKAFALSYHRAAGMQASLAIVGCVTGVAAWMQNGNGWLLRGALLLEGVQWAPQRGCLHEGSHGPMVVDSALFLHGHRSWRRPL
jgi:hypothetical protein